VRRLAQAAVLLVLAEPASAYGPETNYVLHCQGCHLADGSETPGKVPPLAGSVGQFLGVPGGREFLARVPGVANAPLSDAELAALLNWTLARFDAAALPAQLDPYDAAEIGRLRAQPLVDVTSERRRLLDALR
jgi:hypothetical protein